MVASKPKESQTNEFYFFIGLFAMCKYYKFVLFMLETLTFKHFCGIIFLNILIVLPHNADYVAFNFAFGQVPFSVFVCDVYLHFLLYRFLLYLHYYGQEYQPNELYLSGVSNMSSQTGDEDYVETPCL